jgi:HSP20 family protein
MALTRWEPLGLEWPERWRRWLDFDATSEGWMRVEEVREDGTLVVRAELPGVDPEKDVDVSVADGVLHISAKREQRDEKKSNGNYRSEFRYGEFSRDLALPTGVDPGALTATYKDGILEVRVPWADDAKTTPIKVPINQS